ncbi:MAG: caspase family protein [Clostridia bacterium]|nr:caspase family protein [Clostridia bacterium]
MKKLIILLLTLGLLLTAALAEVSLPANLTAIDASAFEGDLALKGRIVLPASVRTIGSYAFAGSGIHALVVPAGCTKVEGTVMADSEAAYLYLNGAETAVSGSLTDVAYVFGPAFGSVSSLNNFYAADTLVDHEGFYYSVTEGLAIPLCAVDGTAIDGDVTIPKLVNGQPVRALDTLIVNGCDNLTGLYVPAYLEMPDHLNVSTYRTMTATAPQTTADYAEVGQTLTWTTTVTGNYGETEYLWTFETDGIAETISTKVPTIDFAFASAGSCIVSVMVKDEVGDIAVGTADALQVYGTDAVYRALLIGNTYTGTSLDHPGSANDVTGMRSMLMQMTATPYRIATRSNLSADGIVSAIENTFSGAAPNDVSLFYFSGHGANASGTSYHGALIGTGTTYLSVARLKTVLDEIPGKKIVILDTCHSGQMISKGTGEVFGVSKEELNSFNSKVVLVFSAQAKGANDLANSGYYVITAAHSTEDAVTMGYDSNGDGVPDKPYGLFTYRLCQGSGWNLATNAKTALEADADDNGEITLYEAYAYARYKVHTVNPNQTAQIYPDNSSMVVWAK